MTNTTTDSLFDRLHAVSGTVHLVSGHVQSLGDSRLEHAAGALCAAAELLDQLVSDAMAGSATLTKRRGARPAPG